uniref:PiggyBac transposable element-derived protein domain-containing protein n=1 Tax=Glossina austeni TaxID=7395 RepID=A0A1A9UWF9_GLOAU
MSQEIQDALNEFHLDTASECSKDSFDIHDNDTENSDGDIIRPGNRCRRIISNDSESDEDIIRPGNRCRRIISNDSESDEDEWSENDKDICLEEYQRTSGVNIIPKNKESVLDIMQLFLGNDLFELFTTETNSINVLQYVKFYKNVRNELQSLDIVSTKLRVFRHFANNKWTITSSETYVEK